jgi:GTPase SAR1 family protein
VNLDPGADVLPYKPVVDAREYVAVEGLMREKGLGPNGALVESMQVLYERRDELLERISRLEADVVLVDTPGQMELFLSHDAEPACWPSRTPARASCSLHVSRTSST